MDNLKEAGQRIRATQSLLRSEGMTEGKNYRDLLTRLATVFARLEAAGFAAYESPPDLSDEEVLQNLLALNLERSCGDRS
jgi:hypothetical protein